MSHEFLRFRNAPAVWIALLLILAAGATAAEDQEVFTLNGDVEPAAYDEETGDVVAVAIYDNEWGVVLIANAGKGKELLDHVGAVVTATGPIRELDSYSEFAYEITVTRYTIEQPAEPAQDEQR
jgi:hypothetical protein